MQVLAGFAVLIASTAIIWAVIAFGWLGIEKLTGWGGEYTALAVAFVFAPIIAIVNGLVVMSWFVQRTANKKGRTE